MEKIQFINQMKPLLYKVNTNFFETPLNKGFQRVLLIEWE